MDLGCLDMCCISVSDRVIASGTVLESENRENDSSESRTATSKIGKSKQMKENAQSSLNSLNKSGSQIKKPSHRSKNSPINWFPRKKVDSYLNRKIKMLQEVAGMNVTLDETLGDSNPHYSKLLREKMASREAASKAIEARKAALVEASWCRILKAARIESKEAETELKKAEETAAEAFEAALAIGVNLYDIPNCPQKPLQVDSSSSSSRERSTASYAVKGCFETAFEVDKEVAAAVKTALIRLAKCPSFKKDEFRDLLRKISQNPDTYENDEEQQQSGGSSSPKSESKSGSETEMVTANDGVSTGDLPPASQLRRRRSKRRLSLEKLNMAKLVNLMFDRLERLQEDELSSLATIVATCGLNAALAEIESNKLHDPESLPKTGIESQRRMSIWGAGKKQVEPELPSLDKFLVKHVTKLEREVQEARNNKKENKGLVIESSHSSETSTVPDLGTILTKKHSSRLEKEIEEKKKNFDKKLEGAPNKLVLRAKEDTTPELPSLDKILVKRVSGLEKAVQEAKNRQQSEPHRRVKEKENLDTNKEFENKGLDKIFVKPVHRLQREKQQALASGLDDKPQKKQGSSLVFPECESLDKVLVKKHVPRLEREKLIAAPPRQLEDDDSAKHSAVSRREARERELQEAWGGLGLGDSMKPHLSKLERDKAAWIKAEEEERKQAMVLSDLC